MAAGEVAQLLCTVGADVRGLQSGLKDAEGQIRGFTSNVTSLFGVAGVVGAIAGIGVAIDKVFDFGAAGAELIRIENGFQLLTQQAGLSGDTIKQQMAEATQGMADLDNMTRQFNKTLVMAGAELAAEYPKMIQIAVAASARGMGDIESLTTAISTGVARGYARSLMQVGIVIDQTAAMESYAVSIGKVANELTQGERSMAIWIAVQDQATKRFGDWESGTDMAGGGIMRLRVVMEDLTEYLQIAAAPTLDKVANSLANMIVMNIPGMRQYEDRLFGIGRMMEDMATGAPYTKLSAGFGLLAESLRQMIVPGGPGFEIWTADIEDLGRYLPLATMSMDQMNQAARRLEQVSLPAALALRKLWMETQDTVQEQQAMITTSQRLMGMEQGVGSAAERAAAEIAALQVRLAGLSDKDVYLRLHIQQQIEMLGGPAAPGYHGPAASALAKLQMPAPGVYTQYQYELLEQRKIVDLQRDTAYQIAEIVAGSSEPVRRVNETLYDYSKRLADWQISEAQRAASGGASAYKDALKDMEGYMSDYQSAISGILQPPGADLTALEDQMGMHRDTWKENYDRAEALARDTANTMRQPWFPEFMAETGMPPGLSVEQAQGFGLNFMREFGMGMRPEAIDWDAFVTAFDEQMTSKLNWQGIMGIGAEQLAAAGLGPENPEVMAAFDFAGAGTMGAIDFAGTFRETLLDQDWGKAGKDAGAVLVTGFGTALKTPGTTFNNTVRDVIISVVHGYFGIPMPGASP